MGLQSRPRAAFGMRIFEKSISFVRPNPNPDKPELTIDDLWMSLRSVIFMIVFHN